MKMKNIFVIIIIFLILCPRMAYSRDNKPKYGFEIGTWQYSLSGTLNFFNPGSNPLIPAFNFSSNLKNNGSFDKNRNFSGAATIKLGNLSDIYISADITRNSGIIDAYSTGDVKVNDVLFGVAGKARVNTQLNSDMIDIMGLREIASSQNGYVNLAYGLRLGRTALNLSNAMGSNSYERNIVLPFAGLDGTCNINDKFRFYSRYIGTNIDIGSGSTGKNYSINEIDAGVEYHLMHPEPEYTEIGPGLPAPRELREADNLDWYLQLGYKEKYMKETEGQNRMVTRNGGPQFKIIIRH